MSNFAPIIVTVYHRLDSLKRCVESLLQNPEAKDSEIWIVSDAASKIEHVALVECVREYIRSIRGFKAVHKIFHAQNMFATNALYEIREQILAQYGYYIFMEDDIVVAPDYLKYMNDGLKFFAEDKRVYAICAFKYPFKMPRRYSHDFYCLGQFSPWGFATWKDRDQSDIRRRYDRYNELRRKKPDIFERSMKNHPNFMWLLKGDGDGVITAEDVRREYHILMNELVCVFPSVSRSQNWGFDARSDHCTSLCGIAIPVLANVNTPHVQFERLDIIGGIDQTIARCFLAAQKVQPLYKRVIENVRWFGVAKTAAYYFERIMTKLGCNA